MSERLTTEQLQRYLKTWQHCEPTSHITAWLSELIELRSSPAQGLTESHRVKVARLADALPIDEEVDRKVTAMLSKQSLGFGPTRKMFTLSAEEKQALAWLREWLPPRLDIGSDLNADECDHCVNGERALAILDRLTRTEGK